MRTTVLPWITLILSLTFAGAPFVTPPFQGFDSDQLPIPQDSPPIEPAGYAFAIWGLIYLWLILSAVYGLRARRDDPAWTTPRIWLSASLLIGTPWLWVAQTSAIWASILIVLMAATAVMAAKQAPVWDRWVLLAPIAVYAGWLTAASFVSVTTTLAGFGLGFDATGWAWVGIPAALATAVSLQLWLGKAPDYGITVCWALVAVVVQNWDDRWPLALLAAAGVAGVGASAIRAARRPA